MGFFSGTLASLPAEVADSFTVAGLAITLYLMYIGAKELWSVINQFVLGRIFGPGIDLKKQGEWAVVTGATDGIGLEYAKKFAQTGLNVVLISRTQAKLDDVAAKLEKFDVKTKTVQFDFTQTYDHYDVIRRELQGLDIAILLNNVSSVQNKQLLTITELPNSAKENTDMLHTNVVSVYMMTTIILPGMIKRRRGVIVNNGSVTAQVALPFCQIYPATKAFTDHFTRCIARECQSNGIEFQSLLPNIVYTNMVKDGLPNTNWFIPTAVNFVNSAFNTIGRTKKTAGYFPHHLLSLLTSLLGEEKGYRLLMEKLIMRGREKTLKEIAQSHRQ